MKSITNKAGFKSILLSLALSFVFIVSSHFSQAQGSAHIIQFSGIVIGGEDTQPVVGAYVYVPKAGRGTSTNNYGFFSLPVMIGDSLLISAVGYKKQFYIIPNKQEKGYSVVIELLTDTTMLPVVEVYPYPTEELFKEAFLALELPDEKAHEAMRKNLSQHLLSQMAMQAGPSGSESFRYYNNQQLNYNANRNFAPTLQFLNPFAWAKFIKQVKQGDFKKKN